jgi:predicted dithiol-disulfide oxidoreductase (DUF899 family)
MGEAQISDPEQRGEAPIASGEAGAVPVFPGESAEYRAARDRLLDRERELRRAIEAAAAARRELPPGGTVPGRAS